MRIAVSVTRQTHLYGKECKEKWTAVYQGGGFSYELKVVEGARGSKALFKFNEVPPEGVPDEVLEAIDEELMDAAGGLP